MDGEKLSRELSDSLGRDVRVEAGPSFWGGVIARLTTDEPARALAALVAAAARLDAQLNPWLSDVQPHRWVLERLLADLRK